MICIDKYYKKEQFSNLIGYGLFRMTLTEIPYMGQI